MASRFSPQKLVVRVRTRRASPACTVLCITTVSRPTRRIPCLDAEDADDHGLSRIFTFTHVYSLHYPASLFSVLCNPHIPTTHTLSSAPLFSPFRGDSTFPGKRRPHRAPRNVSLLRCAATSSSSRRRSPENSRRAHPRTWRLRSGL